MSELYETEEPRDSRFYSRPFLPRSSSCPLRISLDQPRVCCSKGGYNGFSILWRIPLSLSLTLCTKVFVCEERFHFGWGGETRVQVLGCTFESLIASVGSRDFNPFAWLITFKQKSRHDVCLAFVGLFVVWFIRLINSGTANIKTGSIKTIKLYLIDNYFRLVSILSTEITIFLIWNLYFSILFRIFNR